MLDPELYWYEREHFAFMDGRMLRKLRIDLTGDPIVDIQSLATLRGTYVRDLVLREGPKLIGPHQGGINVLNRGLQVEFRTQKAATEDLAPNYAGVKF